MQREQAETDLQLAMDDANVDEFEYLERLVLAAMDVTGASMPPPPPSHLALKSSNPIMSPTTQQTLDRFKSKSFHMDGTSSQSLSQPQILQRSQSQSQSQSQPLSQSMSQLQLQTQSKSVSESHLQYVPQSQSKSQSQTLPQSQPLPHSQSPPLSQSLPQTHSQTQVQASSLLHSTAQSSSQSLHTLESQTSSVTLLSQSLPALLTRPTTDLSSTKVQNQSSTLPPRPPMSDTLPPRPPGSDTLPPRPPVTDAVSPRPPMLGTFTRSPSRLNLNEKAGAGQSALLIATARLAHLKAMRKEQDRIHENLTNAAAAMNMEEIERAVSEADEIGFSNADIEKGRELLATMQDNLRVRDDII